MLTHLSDLPIADYLAKPILLEMFLFLFSFHNPVTRIKPLCMFLMTLFLSHARQKPRVRGWPGVRALRGAARPAPAAAGGSRRDALNAERDGGFPFCLGRGGVDIDSAMPISHACRRENLLTYDGFETRKPAFNIT